MKKLLYAIRDNKVCDFGLPTSFRNHAEAIRAFGDLVGDVGNPNNLYAKHPADFSICYVGEFDTSTGVFNCVDVVQVLAVGTDYQIAPGKDGK